MSELLRQLKTVVVTGEIDLAELDEAYRDPESGDGIRIPFRLNWTRGQKERQRELQQETLDLQKRYLRLNDEEMLNDAEAWQVAKDEADRLSEENWEHWATWWAELLLMPVSEVTALAEAIPEQHWVWITAQVATRAREYEQAALKKVDDGHSPTSGGRGRTRRRSGKKPGSRGS